MLSQNKKLFQLFFLLILFGGFFAVAQKAQAGTYWVSPTGTASWANCQNESPLEGTVACSLATALSNVSAGATVVMRGGEYDRGIVLTGKKGTFQNKIEFLAYAEEIPIIKNTINYVYTDRYHGLHLSGCEYIKLQGITFERALGGYLVQIVNGSSYNEIADCVFDGKGGAVANMWKGNSALGESAATKNNWVHHSTIANTGSITSGCDDSGGFQIGTPSYDNVSGNNTFENNIFYAGGHHNLETFTKNNIIRGNYFHHENGSFSAPNPPCSSLGEGEDGDQYGNRNIQIYDGLSQDGMFNLIEGNRFGHSGQPPDDDGGDSLTLTAPKIITRYNYIFNGQNNNTYIKNGAGSISDNFRFYNNTMYKSGAWYSGTGQWQGANFRWPGGYSYHSIASIEGVDGLVTVSLTAPHRFKTGGVITIEGTSSYNGNHTMTVVDDMTITFSKTGSYPLETSGTARGSWPNLGSVVKNNILHDYYLGGGDWAIGALISTYNEVQNNFCTDTSVFCSGTGDPLFVNTDVSDPTSVVLPDLSLQSSSPAIDGGTYLTLANGVGVSSVMIVVDDALYFQDGTWGSDLSNVQADWIAIGTINNVAEISSIDYDTNTITMASAKTWNDDDPVWLYKKSDGEVVLSGLAPDYGAYEYVNPLQADFDSDSDVDIFDYNILLANFGVTGDCGNPADADGDCNVGIFDYNILLEEFGSGT